MPVAESESPRTTTRRALPGRNLDATGTAATLAVVGLLASVVVVSGCVQEGGGEEESSRSPGERLYRQSLEEGNTFACATCHALEEPTADGTQRPGHPIGNATKRPTYKNGQFDEMLPAVNSCLEEWMNAPTWEKSDEDWQTLRDWLDSQATTDSAEPIEYDVVSPPSDLGGGNAEKGRQIFNNRCAVCHGKDAAGTNKAPALRRNDLAPKYVAERIRLSGDSDSSVYDGLTGGQMPFWSKQRLSDGALRDVVAYVAQGEASPDTGVDAGPDTGMEPDASGDASGDCREPSCKVGQTAELEEKFHNVGGTAEIVDQNTLVIRNFTYDGAGITVKAYGAPDRSSFSDGFVLSEDLTRDQPYEGERLELTIPDGKLLELGAISIWCVDVGQDFGSGAFGP